ncbi:hypothetical protein LTR85_009971 [Meristemomyces frigidus]|nr:hypothetical protein LTR85_009971 [Meristemomyces frigidus]
MRAIALLGLSASLLSGLIDIVWAQSVSFVEPRATALTALGDNLQYDSGENVTISWTTDFDYTTLRVYQGPLDDGSYAEEVLARNFTQATTTFIWKAAAIGDAESTYPFHFELLNAGDSSCDGCTANSVTFYVTQRSVFSSTSSSAATSSTSAASTTSAAALSTHSSTASPTSTNNTVAGAASTNSSSASSTSSRKSLAVPLGVGLGVGIPVLLALVALLAFCLLRRRKRAKAANLPRGRQPEERLSGSQAAMRERGSREPIAPVQQGYMPYRSSTSTPGHPRSSEGGVSRSSSYFEPFDFERPGSREFDANNVMSELAMGGGAVAAARLSAIQETPNWPLPA